MYGCPVLSAIGGKWLNSSFLQECMELPEAEEFPYKNVPNKHAWHYT